MQRFWRTFLLVALLAAAIGSKQEADGGRDAADDWVRTAEGWQPRHTLLLERPPSRSQLHPAVVASLQAGLSVLALLALPSRGKCEGQGGRLQGQGARGKGERR